MAEHIFSGIDAATYFVPGDDDEPPPHIEKIINRSSVSRVYPMQGGHLWMVPYAAVKGHEALFERKDEAWDHAHCDYCNESINIGDMCWKTTNQDMAEILFCNQCTEKIKSK